MIDPVENNSVAVDLYRSVDEKVDAARGEIGELRDALSEYARRIEVLKNDQNHFKNRLEEGVSKTAFKAWEAAQEIKTGMAKVDGRLEKHEILIDEIMKRLDRSDKFDDRVIYGILIVIFISIFSTVMAFLWNYRGH